jgi:hypothetical protein
MFPRRFVLRGVHHADGAAAGARRVHVCARNVDYGFQFSNKIAAIEASRERLVKVNER